MSYQKFFLGAVIALLRAGLTRAQRSAIRTTASAEPILYLLADSERDLTRLPAKFTRMSDSEEVAAGDAIAAASRQPSESLSPKERAVEEYIQRVGQHISARAARKLPYRFHYVPDHHFINAYALPGGHIFVSAGLMDLLDTEDELAAVIAHEVEHVDHYHCAERLQMQQALNRSPVVVAIPVTVFQMGYSKADERQADGEGLELAAEAGYSANGMLRLLRKFERLDREASPDDRTPQDEINRVATDAVIGYFASHPPIASRIDQTIVAIARNPRLAAPAERPIQLRTGA